MKTLRFLIALSFCCALARASSLGRSAGEDFKQTRSENLSNSGSARQAGPTSTGSDQADEKQRQHSSTVAREQRVDTSHSTAERTSLPGEQSSASAPRSMRAAIGAAARGQKEFGKTSGTSTTGAAHHLPLSQSLSVSKDARNGTDRNHAPASTPFREQKPAALPVQPAQNRASSLSTLDGTTAASLAKNTAALNGTGLRHRP